MTPPFIFTDTAADDPLTRRTFQMVSAGREDDWTVHISAEAPLMLRVSLQYSLDAGTVRELRDLLNQWLGDTGTPPAEFTKPTPPG